MSFQMMAWAVKQEAGGGVDKAVLMCLANITSQETGLCCPRVETIARETEFHHETVRKALVRLAERGLISRERERRQDGSLGVYSYRFPTHSGDQAAESGVGQTAESGRVSRSKANQEVPHLASLGEGARVVPLIVNRKRATTEEMKLALEVLTSWNLQTGQSLTSRDWYSKIIMRVREHPELGLAEHERIIRAALDDPWWKGPPGPEVIYGNGRIFEKSMTVASGRGDPRGRVMTGATIRALADEAERQGL